MSDINELMSRDPLHHTTESIDEIIEKFRASRHLWAAGIKEAKAPKKKAPSVKVEGLDAGDIEL